MDSKPNGFEQDRFNILRMVEEGKLSATEAASLLSALNSSTPNQEKTTGTEESIGATTETAPESASQTVIPSQSQRANQAPHWFRIRVTDLSSGRAKATINLPIGLVNWGMKVGARYAPEIDGLDFNELSQILQSGADGKLIDVTDEEDGEHVEIFVD
jgi:hypothetical protein